MAQTRRSLFGSSAAVLATSLAVTATILSDDPDWTPEPVRVVGPDDALLAAIARGREIYKLADEAGAKGGWHLDPCFLDHCREVAPLDEFIFATRPLTREGVMAKAAYALKGYKPPKDGGRAGAFHFPYSALLDLYRAAGGVA